MIDEQIVSIHSSMQFLPTRLPVIALQRVEEELPVSEIMVGVICLCADKRVLPSYSREIPKNKMFSRNHMVPYIFCGLSF
jgi:hypothetical protein